MNSTTTAPPIVAHQGLLSVLRAPREILFGWGQRAALPRVAVRLGTTALIVADPYVAGSDEVEVLRRALHAAGVRTEVHSDVVPELPTDTLDGAVRAAQRLDADVIVGIGGGSSIDLAKVAALLLAHGGPVSRYYGEFAVPGPTVPVIAMPTTAGTGSEVTPVAVLTDAERGSKVGISSPHLIPTVAICDPELTMTCPPHVTLASGVDALSHCVESFMAVRRDPADALATERVFVGKGPLTDDLALSGIRSIVAGLPAALERPQDAEARTVVMLGALRAGLAFGTAGTGAAHAIQYPVGAATHTPHGIGVGVLLPAVMAYNAPSRTQELAAIASELGGIGSIDERAAAAPGLMAELLARIGVPASLEALGFPHERLEWAAEQSMQAARLVENNPEPLTSSGALRILEAAFAGSTTLATTGAA